MNRQRRRPQAEKVEIALERGQVTTVLVGSVVALGLVFLMGVVFGSRLAVAAETGEIGSVVAAAAPTEEKPELTFHDALTTRRTGGPSSEVAAAQSAPVAPQDQASRAEAAPRPEPSVRPEARPAEAPSAPPRAVAAPAPSSAASDGAPTFTVQVSSSRDETDTKRLADRLEAAGWDARVVAADIEGRGRWYRVRVGRYGTREEAMRRQAELQQAFHLSGLVVAEQ